MKNIDVQINFSCNKKISVLFDIGERFEIPTKTQAKKFQYDFKKLIKENISMLSDLQSRIYTSYRSNYLQLPTRTGRDILRNIREFDKKIDFIFKEYAQGNGSFLYRAIEDCYSSINYAALLLKDHGQRYKSFMLKNDMNSLLGHLNNLEKSFERDKRNLDMNFTHRKKQNIKIVKFKAS